MSKQGRGLYCQISRDGVKVKRRLAVYFEQVLNVKHDR